MTWLTCIQNEKTKDKWDTVWCQPKSVMLKLAFGNFLMCIHLSSGHVHSWMTSSLFFCPQFNLVFIMLGNWCLTCAFRVVHACLKLLGTLICLCTSMGTLTCLLYCWLALKYAFVRMGTLIIIDCKSIFADLHHSSITILINSLSKELHILVQLNKF